MPRPKSHPMKSARWPKSSFKTDRLGRDESSVSQRRRLVQEHLKAEGQDGGGQVRDFKGCVAAVCSGRIGTTRPNPVGRVRG